MKIWLKKIVADKNYGYAFPVHRPSNADSFDWDAGPRLLFQPLTQFARVHCEQKYDFSCRHFRASKYPLNIRRQTHVLNIFVELVFVPGLFAAVARYCYRQSHLNAYLFIVSILLSSHHNHQRRFAVVVFIFFSLISHFYPTRRMSSLYTTTKHTIAFALDSQIPRCHFNTLLKMMYRNKGCKWLICFFTTFITNFSQNINIYSPFRCCFIRISSKVFFSYAVAYARNIYRNIMVSSAPIICWLRIL